jgi:hypothetical protein
MNALALSGLVLLPRRVKLWRKETAVTMELEAQRKSLDPSSRNHHFVEQPSSSEVDIHHCGFVHFVLGGYGSDDKNGRLSHTQISRADSGIDSTRWHQAQTVMGERRG